MTRRAAKRRIRTTAKPETRAASSPDPTVILPHELEPQPGRPIYRFQFRDGYVDVDALAWDKKGDEQKLRAFGPIAEELRQTSTELHGIKQERREGSRTAIKGKREKAEKRARGWADDWNDACREHPTWSKKTIGADVIMPKWGVGEKTMLKRLDAARKLGLISPRHRRVTRARRRSRKS